MTEHQTNVAAAEVAGRKLRIDRRGALAVVTLDRPRVLNAFDDEMCRTMADEIPRIARDPDLYIVALQSAASPKVFCAGGDILALTDAARQDVEVAKTYLRNEYSLNWLLECFSKPVASFIDGLCMGSGAGLTCYNTHRIAGEGYKWAMPETRIGFFPDVGVANILARMPWPVGLYLGLTGRTIRRDDAQWLGLVTHCISAARFSDIQARLCDAEPVDPLLDGLNELLPPGPLQHELPLVAEFFAPQSIAGIFAALAGARGAGAEWAQKTLADLRQRSPLALAVTDRHIRNARAMDRRETLAADYRLAVRFLEISDLFAGVTAVLREKKPDVVWSPPLIEDVSSAAVDGFFEPLGESELVLPSRSEMQQSRV